MKKIFFLLVFTLQFSLFSFSQSDGMHHYTDAELLKLSTYVKELESKRPVDNLPEAEQSDKALITNLFNRTPHDYTNAEIIKIANYIKYIENPILFAGNSPVDTLTHYTDPEVEKFATYIQELETRISASVAVQLDPEEKQKIADLLSAPSKEFKDAEIIVLANYIKNLEKLDSTATFALVLAQEDSLAVAVVTDSVKEIEGVTELEKYEKMIFFNFDSSTLKKESYTALDEAVKILKNSAELSFVIEGHTDNVGSDAYNMALSKRRAASVRRYFISKGIPATRISSAGYGEVQPIDTNATEEGRAKNRRVKINVKK